MTVQSSGKLDLATNNASGSLGTLVLMVGPTSSADVVTGTGTLTLQNNVSSLVQGGTTAASPAATLAGNLALGATRTFTINRSLAPTDVTISAVISGTGFGPRPFT